MAIVGPRAAWPGDTPRRFADFADGTASTLLVIEADPHEVNWMEPRDVTYEEAIELLSSRELDYREGHRYENFFYQYSAGRNVGLGDGSVHFFYFGLPHNTATKLINVRDGKAKLPESRYDSSTATKRLRIDNCFRLGLFVVIVLWPLPWVWVRPKPTGRTARSDPKTGRSS
jgi:hypothetical protein